MALSESQNEQFHQPQSTKIQKIKSSVIRKKGESHNGCFKKTKHPKFFEKQAFFTPWYAHVRVRIRG